MQCSSLKINRCFGETCRLLIQGWKISQARNRRRAVSKPISACCLLNAAGGGHVSPKSRLTFNGLDDIICQKIELSISTSVRTSNRTFRKGAVVAYSRNYPGIFREGVRKTMETSVRIVGVQSEIQTGHLPNTSLELYLQPSGWLAVFRRKFYKCTKNRILEPK
jgi:hypothetical protein